MVFSGPVTLVKAYRSLPCVAPTGMEATRQVALQLRLC
jgi:hypothetical protein